MGMLPPSPHFDKALQAVYVPYIATNWDEGKDIFGVDGWMFEFQKPTYAKTGIELLGYSFAGLSGYGSTKGPVIKPSDIKDLGIKTRVWCTGDRLLFEPLGGTVHISWPEVYTALETGVVHAQDNAQSILNRGVARHGVARLGKARQGRAGRGEARSRGGRHPVVAAPAPSSDVKE